MEKGHILVVDDDPQTRGFLSEHLTRRGFSVQTVSSAGEAIQEVRRCRFDVAICDLQMPVIDGLSCLETMTRLAPALHVIMISGEATVEKVVKAMKKGAYDFLQKPLPMEHLLFQIEKALLNSQLEQGRAEAA